MYPFHGCPFEFSDVPMMNLALITRKNLMQEPISLVVTLNIQNWRSFSFSDDRACRNFSVELETDDSAFCSNRNVQYSSVVTTSQILIILFIRIISLNFMAALSVPN